MFKRLTLLLSLCAVPLTNTSLEGCTGIKLTAQDGSFVHGRTLEFGIQVDTAAAVIPRNYTFTGTTNEGPGLEYKSKFAAVGATAFDLPALMDGLNEKGLAVGTFYFPGFAKYSTITKENQQRALSPVDFPNWLLTQFETVDEVKAALDRVVVAPTIVKAWGEAPPPFHYIVYDKAGKCLVIEPIEGKLVSYDNPLGTFTNSPSFDWHMTNLRNYINLTNFNAKPLTVDGIKFAPFGEGSGMVGMPGDFTPPSRFVRAAIYTITALPTKDAVGNVSHTFHILNQFDIPLGSVRSKEGDNIYSDSTLLTCVRDPVALKYYFKTYANQTIKVVDLNEFDLDAKTIKSRSTTSDQPYLNISKELI